MAGTEEQPEEQAVSNPKEIEVMPDGGTLIERWDAVVNTGLQKIITTQAAQHELVIDDFLVDPLLIAAENHRQPNLKLTIFYNTPDFVQYLDDLAHLSHGSLSNLKAVVATYEKFHYVPFNIEMHRGLSGEPKFTLVGICSVGGSEITDDLKLFLNKFPFEISAGIQPTQMQAASSGCNVYAKSIGSKMDKNPSSIKNAHQNLRGSTGVRLFAENGIGLHPEYFKHGQNTKAMEAVPGYRYEPVDKAQQETLEQRRSRLRAQRHVKRFSQGNVIEEVRQVNISLEERRKLDYRRGQNFLAELSQQENGEERLVEMLNAASPSRPIGWDNELTELKTIFGSKWDSRPGLTYYADNFEAWVANAALNLNSPETLVAAGRELLNALPTLHWPSQLRGAMTLLNKMLLVLRKLDGSHLHTFFQDIDFNVFSTLFERPSCAVHSHLIFEIDKFNQTYLQYEMSEGVTYALPLPARLYGACKDENVPISHRTKAAKELVEAGVIFPTEIIRALPKDIRFYLYFRLDLGSHLNTTTGLFHLRKLNRAGVHIPPEDVFIVANHLVETSEGLIAALDAKSNQIISSSESILSHDASLQAIGAFLSQNVEDSEVSEALRRIAGYQIQLNNETANTLGILTSAQREIADYMSTQQRFVEWYLLEEHIERQLALIIDPQYEPKIASIRQQIASLRERRNEHFANENLYLQNHDGVVRQSMFSVNQAELLRGSIGVTSLALKERERYGDLTQSDAHLDTTLRGERMGVLQLVDTLAMQTEARKFNVAQPNPLSQHLVTIRNAASRTLSLNLEDSNALREFQNLEQALTATNNPQGLRLLMEEKHRFEAWSRDNRGEALPQMQISDVAWQEMITRSTRFVEGFTEHNNQMSLALSQHENQLLVLQQQVLNKCSGEEQEQWANHQLAAIRTQIQSIFSTAPEEQKFVFLKQRLGGKLATISALPGMPAFAFWQHVNRLANEQWIDHIKERLEFHNAIVTDTLYSATMTDRGQLELLKTTGKTLLDQLNNESLAGDEQSLIAFLPKVRLYFAQWGNAPSLITKGREFSVQGGLAKHKQRRETLNSIGEHLEKVAQLKETAQQIVDGSRGAYLAELNGMETNLTDKKRLIENFITTGVQMITPADGESIQQAVERWHQIEVSDSPKLLSSDLKMLEERISINVQDQLVKSELRQMADTLRELVDQLNQPIEINTNIRTAYESIYRTPVGPKFSSNRTLRNTLATCIQELDALDAQKAFTLENVAEKKRYLKSVEDRALPRTVFQEIRQTRLRLNRNLVVDALDLERDLVTQWRAELPAHNDLGASHHVRRDALDVALATRGTANQQASAQILVARTVNDCEAIALALQQRIALNHGVEVQRIKNLRAVRPAIDRSRQDIYNWAPPAAPNPIQNFRQSPFLPSGSAAPLAPVLAQPLLVVPPPETRWQRWMRRARRFLPAGARFFIAPDHSHIFANMPNYGAPKKLGLSSELPKGSLVYKLLFSANIDSKSIKLTEPAAPPSFEESIAQQFGLKAESVEVRSPEDHLKLMRGEASTTISLKDMTGATTVGGKAYLLVVNTKKAPILNEQGAVTVIAFPQNELPVGEHEFIRIRKTAHGLILEPASHDQRLSRSNSRDSTKSEVTGVGSKKSNARK